MKVRIKMRHKLSLCKIENHDIGNCHGFYLEFGLFKLNVHSAEVYFKFKGFRFIWDITSFPNLRVFRYLT